MRLKNLTLLTVIMLILPTLAYAGITDWIVDHAMGTIVSSLFIIITAFFGGTAWGKYIIKSKVPLNDLIDAGRLLYIARKAKSPGGKDITKDEWENILKKLSDTVKSTVEVFGKK